MITVRLNHSDNSLTVKRVIRTLKLVRVGQRGPKGDEGDSGTEIYIGISEPPETDMLWVDTDDENDWEFGDMDAAVYDPTNKSTDAFSMDNMAETSTKKVFTSTERTKLTGMEPESTSNAFAHGIVPVGIGGTGELDIECGFQPSRIEFESMLTSSNASASYSTGYWDEDVYYTMAITSRSDAVDESASRYWEDSCLSLTYFTTGAALARYIRINPVSINPTGFTINIITIVSSGSVVKYKAYK